MPGPVAYSSGRPVGPDGNPIDEAPPPSGGLLGGFAPPPENPAVLSAIAATLANSRNEGPVGTGAPSFTGNPYFEAARQPGMSGYFDAGPNGNITPHDFSAQQAAAGAGLSLGGLASSIIPSQGGGGVGYNLPNDQGGFFTLDDLFRQSSRGMPLGGAMQIGSNLPSTNNWRLLGMGPGWIMRNGHLIDTRSSGLKSGMLAGGTNAGGTSGENAGFGFTRYVSPFNAITGNNVDDAYYWPGAASASGGTRWPAGTNV